MIMTTMQRRPVDDEPQERHEFEMPTQLDDDDYFEPTIVRGRE
jgi:hypothetical protein